MPEPVEHLERLRPGDNPSDLHRFAFDLYRIERGNCWTGEIPTAHRMNIVVDWWNGRDTA